MTAWSSASRVLRASLRLLLDVSQPGCARGRPPGQLMAALFGLCMVGAIPGTAYAVADRPNVVLVVADDLGWNDVGFHGSEILTPNLDAMSRRGVLLERFYVQPSCSPTRTELMTGQSALALGVFSPFSKLQPAGVPLSERMMPEYFLDAGYQTFMVGKWHLGFRQPAFRPNNRGFEHFYGHLTGGIGYWDHVHGGGLDWQRNGATLREDGYSTHLMRDEALRLIRERDAQRPFLLYVAFNAPHLPGEAPRDALAAYEVIPDPNRRLHAAMVSEMDAAIGMLVRALRDQNLLENTLFWFMSDNGGLNPSVIQPPVRALASLLDDWFGDRAVPVRALEFLRLNALYGAGDNAPLRGGKQSVYEGGIRVPSFLYWPERLAPASLADVITAVDVLPTVLSAAGLSAPANTLEGRDRWAVLQGKTGEEVGDYVVTGLDGEAIIRFPWKLVALNSAEPELYRLDDDPREQRNLAGERPELAHRLQLALAGESRADALNLPLWQVLGDPDFFGGAEDRRPWSEWQPEQ